MICSWHLNYYIFTILSQLVIIFMKIFVHDLLIMSLFHWTKVSAYCKFCLTHLQTCQLQYKHLADEVDSAETYGRKLESQVSDNTLLLLRLKCFCDNANIMTIRSHSSFITRMMKLLSRRRWRLASAQVSYKFEKIITSFVLALRALPLGQIRAFISR